VNGALIIHSIDVIKTSRIQMMSIPEYLLCTGCRLLAGLLLSVFALSALAETDFSQVSIKTTEVAPGIYMLEGLGGNIGLSIGDDGVFVIDDQFAPLTARIQQAIAALTEQPVRFVVNTHWHIDHAGGNENLGKAGAIIVAHDNVRKRLQKGQFVAAFNAEIPAAPPAALPIITFDQSVTFHWNNETLEVLHVAPSHTDGDAVIYLKDANVVHTGDLYWNGLYPVIDASSGGSAAGMVSGVGEVLARIDSNTKVIPGHGPLSNKAELQVYHEMLNTAHVRIKALKDEGKTIEQIIGAKPTADYDEQWGNALLSPEQWVQMVYSTL
jgi:glyoxylase-like metal-dependent hydrolase (beta-lactamase superfamily II)